MGDQAERQMMALVQQYRERECADLLAAAHDKRREILAEAYRQARQQLHLMVDAERSRAVSHVHGAQAALQTRRRTLEQNKDLALIDAGWSLLELRLRASWDDPGDRRRWVRRCAGEALGRLPAGAWTVHHPVRCTEADLQPLVEALMDSGMPGPATIEEPAIEAGLVVRAGKAVLDMSLPGLLHDRRTIEARLLALVQGEATA